MAEIDAGEESLRLAENVAARKHAREIIELIESDTIISSKRFWMNLATMAIDKLPKNAEPCDDVAMTFEETQRFERKTFPPYSRIGWLAGKRVLDATTEEIARWLDDDEFTHELRRYAQSPRFRERQRAEEAQRPDHIAEADRIARLNR